MLRLRRALMIEAEELTKLVVHDATRARRSNVIGIRIRIIIHDHDRSRNTFSVFDVSRKLTSRHISVNVNVLRDSSVKCIEITSALTKVYCLSLYINM